MRLASTDNPIRAWAGVHLTAMIVAFLPGLIVFGWRGAATVLLVVFGTAVGWVALRRVGPRGQAMEPAHLLWSALVAAALLPAHLAATTTLDGDASAMWAAPIATGLTLVLLVWLTAARFGIGVLPALTAGLLTWAALGPAAQPSSVLRWETAVTGDLVDSTRSPVDDLAGIRWVSRRADEVGTPDARRLASARMVLSAYGNAELHAEGRRVTMASVVSERLPPPEDVVLLGHPAPIGMGGAAAVVAAGLVLCFRGVADARIAIVVVASAYVSLATMPVVAAVDDFSTVWTHLAGIGGMGELPGARVGWATGLTFVHYELLAGPILFGAMLLAPLSSLRPLRNSWRFPYAVAIGVAMAAMQRYVEPNVAPLAALAGVALLTPLLDRWSRSTTLIE
ncbi:MAG: hypothetical protein AAGI46_10645 [Planctomycetota bacterium]